MHAEHLKQFIPPDFELDKYQTQNMNLFDWAYNLSVRSGLYFDAYDEDIREFTTQNLIQGASPRDDSQFGLRTDDVVSVVREITCYQVLAMGDELDEKMQAKALYSELSNQIISERHNLGELSKFITEIDGYYDFLVPEPAWLEIDMACSDKEIKSAFDAWLKAKRAENESKKTTAKRREYKLNEFSEATLRRWHNARVLAYLDLEAWNYLQGNKVTSKQYGEILFPEYQHERDNTSYINDTVKPLVKLLTCGDLHQRMRKIYIDSNRQK